MSLQWLTRLRNDTLLHSIILVLWLEHECYLPTVEVLGTMTHRHRRKGELIFLLSKG